MCGLVHEIKLLISNMTQLDANLKSGLKEYEQTLLPYAFLCDSNLRQKLAESYGLDS